MMISCERVYLLVYVVDVVCFSCAFSGRPPRSCVHMCANSFVCACCHGAVNGTSSITQWGSTWDMGIWGSRSEDEVLWWYLQCPYVGVWRVCRLGRICEAWWGRSGSATSVCPFPCSCGRCGRQCKPVCEQRSAAPWQACLLGSHF